ncbi:MAG: hypothetical protein CMP20_02635 [Rickettsiales bacterium]|nr:hypothetical protein [Rickettsiales bacterium]
MITLAQWTGFLSIDAKRDRDKDEETDEGSSKRSRGLDGNMDTSDVELIDIRKDMLYTERLIAIEENLVRLGAYQTPFDVVEVGPNPFTPSNIRRVLAPVDPDFDAVNRAQRQVARDLYAQWLELVNGATKAYDLLSKRQEQGYDDITIIRLLAKGIADIIRFDVYDNFPLQERLSLTKFATDAADFLPETKDEERLRQIFFKLKPPNSDFSSRPYIQDTLERMVAYLDLGRIAVENIPFNELFAENKAKAANKAERQFFIIVEQYISRTKVFVNTVDKTTSYSDKSNPYERFGGLYYIGAYKMPIDRFLAAFNSAKLGPLADDDFVTQRMKEAIKDNEIVSKQDVFHYAFKLLDDDSQIALAFPRELTSTIRIIVDPDNMFWEDFENVYFDMLTFVDEDGTVLLSPDDFFQLFNSQNRRIVEFAFDDSYDRVTNLNEAERFSFSLNIMAGFFIFGDPLVKERGQYFDPKDLTVRYDNLIKRFVFRSQMFTLSYKDRYGLLEQFTYFEMYRRLVSENTDEEGQTVYEMCSGLRLPYVYDKDASSIVAKWSKSLFYLAKNKPWRYTVVVHYFKTLLKQHSVSFILNFAKMIARYKTEFDNLGVGFEQICLEMIRKRIFNEDPEGGFNGWANFITLPDDNQGTASFLTFFWEQFGVEKGDDILQVFSEALSVFALDPTVDIKRPTIGTNVFAEMLDHAEHFSSRSLCTALGVVYKHDTVVQSDLANLQSLLGFDDTPRIEMMIDRSFIAGPKHADARYTQTRQSIIEAVDSVMDADVYQDLQLATLSDVSPEQSAEMLEMLAETLSI